jgi:cytoskeletal protein CcmA (bactofilin family)
MRNPFKNTGFDTLIGLHNAYICSRFYVNGEVVIEGHVTADLVGVNTEATGKQKQSLKVIGSLAAGEITHPHLIVSGSLEATSISVGRLVVSKKAVLKATSIVYDELVIEPGAHLEVGSLTKKVSQPAA